MSRNCATPRPESGGKQIGSIGPEHGLEAPAGGLRTAQTRRTALRAMAASRRHLTDEIVFACARTTPLFTSYPSAIFTPSPPKSVCNVTLSPNALHNSPDSSGRRAVVVSSSVSKFRNSSRDEVTERVLGIKSCLILRRESFGVNGN